MAHPDGIQLRLSPLISQEGNFEHIIDLKSCDHQAKGVSLSPICVQDSLMHIQHVNRPLALGAPMVFSSPGIGQGMACRWPKPFILKAFQG